MITIFGAKGGVGATTFISDVAGRIARHRKVLMVDADPESKNDLGNMFGRVAKKLREASEYLDSEILFTYLGAGKEDLNLVRLVQEDDVMIFLRLASLYDVVLVDAGVGVSSYLEVLLKYSIRTALVANMDCSSKERICHIYKSLRILNKSPEELDLVVSGRETREIFFDGFDDLEVARIYRSHSDYAQMIVETDFTNKKIELPCDAMHDRLKLKEKIMTKIVGSKELKKIIADNASSKEIIERKIKDEIETVLIDEGVTDLHDKAELITEVIRETMGLGLLEEYLLDKNVTEIMVNGTQQIYVERCGRIEGIEKRFASERSLYSIIERIVSSVGRRVDELSPIVDARLSDGSRVHVVIPPLSLTGPVITIRKFRENILGTNDLIESGSLSTQMADMLISAVKARANIVVAGGTGSGKTTLLNVLSSYIPEDERIITIEDSAELKMNQPHVVRLESRPVNLEGRGEVTIRDLVRASLRMRPDRIIVGECRGSETLDMLQAMNTGHDGSLTTVHANSARDSLSRLETLVMFAGFELPVKVIRQQIVSAIDLIIYIAREKDGTRKIKQISEITGLEGDVITMQDIFIHDDGKYQKIGFDPECLKK